MSWGPVLDHWFAITGVADLDRSCRLGEAALDSLQMLELRTIVEKSGISLSDDALSLLTISDLVTALDRHGPPAVAPPGYEAMSAGLSAPGRYLSSAQLPPDLNAAGCSLQTLEPADLDFLYALATGPATGYRWRYRGAFPPADQFRIDVWSGVLSQFVVWRGPEPARRAGLVVCYQADLVNGTGYVGSVFTPELQNQGIAASVTQCFMRYLFKVYPFRKIYLEVPEFNFDQFASGQGRHFDIEGVLRGHDFYNGQYWDKLILAVYPAHLQQ